MENRQAEVYGFVGWAASFVAYVIFLVWSVVPDEALHAIGITYYPQKYWAVAVPIWLVSCWIFATLLYFSTNWISTEPLDSYYTVTDKHAREYDSINEGFLSSLVRVCAHLLGSGSFLSCFLSLSHKDEDLKGEGIPPLTDIPIDVLNRILYQTPTDTKDNVSIS